MTFINLLPGLRGERKREARIPHRREQAARIALAQAVRALPAHADRAGGPGDAAGRGEDVEEAGLAIDGPTSASLEQMKSYIGSVFWGRGESRGGQLVHCHRSP